MSDDDLEWVVLLPLSKTLFIFNLTYVHINIGPRRPVPVNLHRRRRVVFDDGFVPLGKSLDSFFLID